MTSEQQAHGADEAARYDVAVVGYGPTGLVAASMLGRAGYRVMVIERWPTPYGLPRLTHIDGETARIVQASGEIQRALRSAKAVDTYHYRDAAGDLLLELNWSGRACGYPAHISIYQPDIEDAVEARAKGYPNVTVLRGWEVDTLKQDEQGVTLSAHPRRGGQDAQWTDAPREFRVRYVIGADGANSFVRRTLGIERSDFGYNERWLNLDSENKRDLGAACALTTIYCDPARAYMHMPIGTRRTRFELRVLPGEETADWEQEDAGWRWLHERYGLGPDDLKLLRHVVYTFETRIAERWREGRVFLAGDAAHTMMPYMGQGACSGMRDGINLAWKLDLVLSGRASEDLLDSYEAERRPHVTAITQMSLFLGQVVNEDDLDKVAQRDAAFRAGQVPPMPPFPRIEHGVLGRGRDGGLAAATGAPAPQGRVRQGAAEGCLDEVIGYGFQLVAREHPARHLDESQLRFLEQLGCRYAVLSVDGAGRDAVVDLDGDQQAFLDAHGIQAYLSRPDFAVFGSVATLDDLGALVDDLRRQLHWRADAIGGGRARGMKEGASMSTEISAAAQALQRAMPVTRLLDCGMDYADAIALHARTAQGEPWDMAAEALAEAQFARAGQAERAGHPVTARDAQEKAIACLLFAQMAYNDDTPRKRQLYARLSAATRRLAGLSELPVERVELPFNGARLIGWLVRPAARAARGTVIVFGGQSGWGMAYWPIARQLAARGLATLLAEGRARGNTAGAAYPRGRGYGGGVSLLCRSRRGRSVAGPRRHLGQ